MKSAILMMLHIIQTVGQGIVPFQERGECQWQKLCAVETPGKETTGRMNK